MSIRHTPQEEPLNTPNTPRGEGEGEGRSTALEGQASIDVGIEGLQPEDIPAWRKIFVPYENLATNDDIARRALYFATQVWREHDEATQNIKYTWYTIEQLYRGRTLAPNPDGVHLAEVYKAVETLAPRLEDPFLESDPWFAVNGRTQTDDRLATKIEALLNYQLDVNKFQSRVIPESSREILKKNQVIAKVSWDHDVQTKVKRNPKREVKSDGSGIRFTFNREEKEEIVYEGPKVDFISSWWFMIDPKDPNPQTSPYVGDVTDMTYDEIERLGKQGVFANYDGLARQTRQDSPNLTESLEASQMSTSPFSYLPESRMVEGGVRKFPVLELWCRFDAFGEGRTREFVITVANWNTVLRVQENFYDDKHRPYVYGRVSKDSFDAYGVGPLEHCVPIQNGLDKHHQIADKAHELSAFPPMVSDDDEFEESWWDIEPGQVLKGNANAVQQLKIQSNLRDIVHIHEVYRREIEEIAGAPRSFAGTEDAAQTATQYQGRIEEGNRRTRGVITSLASFYEGIVRQFHALNRQFMSRAGSIPVLGKAGMMLGDYTWLGPDDIDADVSLEITALRGLQQRGMKATNAIQLLQATAPFIQGNPGMVNIPKLLKVATNGLMGPGLANEIIDEPDSTRTLMDQMYESQEMIRTGEYLDVQPGDDDELHIANLEALFDDELFQQLPDNTQQILMMHYSAHILQARNKGAQRGAGQNFVPSSPASSMVAPGQGTLPSDMGGGQQVPGQTSGETPGPASMARQATPGRVQPVPQTQNSYGQ